jgi:hypothetical protein
MDEICRAYLFRASETAPILSFLVLNKQPPQSARDFPLESQVNQFLNILEVSSVVGLGLGALVAARRGKLRPLANAWGVTAGAALAFPASLALKFPTPRVDLVADAAQTRRHRRALVAAGISASLFPLLGGGLFAGAQLGLAVARLADELPFF